MSSPTWPDAFLAKRSGTRHRVAGRIHALTYHPASRVFETTIRLEDGWRSHAAGQFAFVTSDRPPPAQTVGLLMLS